MLVLSRKVGETIYIGEDIQIKVMSVDTGYNNQQVVRVGINAPKSKNIDREEIRQERVKRIDGLLDGHIPKRT